MEAKRDRGEEGLDVAMTLLPRVEKAPVVQPDSQQNCAGENVVHVTVEEPCLEGDTRNSNSSSSKCRNDIVCFPLIALRECSAERARRVRRPVLCALKCGLLLLFIVYIAFAFHYEFGSEASLRLLVCTIVGVVVLVVRRLSRWQRAKSACDKARACVQPCNRFYQRHSTWFSRFLTAAVCLAILAFLIFDVVLRRPTRLVSVLGVVVFVAFMFFFSHSPRQVRWRPILWGLLLQLVFALLVLRTDAGKQVFSWLSLRFTDYLSFTDKGAEFVFGSSFRDHFMAFRVMPTIVFFSATISILYYLGVMQVLIKAIARVMEVTMTTGPTETLHSAVNIFCGWAESIVLVRPFLEDMSLAELHAIMTNGFSTVAGSTLAAYILYGVSADHLISASFMSAPAALAMSNLFYPKETKGKSRVCIQNVGSVGTGIVDAASLGAVAAISLISHILVNVIAFICLLGVVNGTFAWLGERIGLVPPAYPALSFQLICSYLLWPLVFLLGVPAHDCRIVARLLGEKIFINEFVAYADLGQVRKNRLAMESHVTNNGTWISSGYDGILLMDRNITLTGGVISPRSEMLATYALCGFSDFVALGIMMAALSTVVPSRRPDLLKVGPRALLSGIVACLLTAAVAGVVADD